MATKMVYSRLVALKNQTINLVPADSAQNGPSHLYNQHYYNRSVRPKNILKDLPFIITFVIDLLDLPKKVSIYSKIARIICFWV